MAGIGKKEPSEYEIQKAVIEYWELVSKQLGIPAFLLFHIPNEGTKNPIRGKLLKAIGVRAGVPDLFLAVPTGSQHGLFLELKRKGGTVSEGQKKFIGYALGQGYAVQVAYSVDEAINVINYYCQPLFEQLKR